MRGRLIDRVTVREGSRVLHEALAVIAGNQENRLVEQVAVANALDVATRLRAGQLVKVGIPQPDTPRRR